jgi:hypothetical protein
MPGLIVPESTPPQVAPEAKKKLADTILARGLPYLWETSLPVFELLHQDLRRFVRDFTFEQNGILLEDDRPQRAFRIGAVIAGRAYLESGFDQSVDGEPYSLATMDADLEGIPRAYLLSYLYDAELQSLVDIILSAPEMQDGADQGSYEEIVAIGAGCTRHYLKYAVEPIGY